MVQLIWAERAIKDLNSIAEYIEVDSEQAAKNFVAELIKKANTLVPHPWRGRPIPENIPGNYRQILFKSYRIIYRIDNQFIIIASLYHQKRLLFKIEN
ncbi:MAG: type II toxin-antitoxin system RelE/ParE family toxin [Bacteroidota bacterium]|nr:type II toxin-antitoxin system RelE/ParE family toxin [Bacteroidota bacterium]